MSHRFPSLRFAAAACVAGIGLRRLCPRMRASSTTIRPAGHARSAYENRQPVEPVVRRAAHDPRSVEPSRPVEPAGRDASWPERGHGQPARHGAKAAKGLLHRSRRSAEEVRAAAADGGRRAGRRCSRARPIRSTRRRRSSATATSRMRRRRSSTFISKYPEQPVPADRAVLARQRAVCTARLQGIDGDLAESGEELSDSIRGRRKRCWQLRTISSSKVRRLRPRRRWSRSSRNTAARTSRSRPRARCRRSSSSYWLSSWQ